MKCFYLIVGIVAGCGWLVLAQTNTTNTQSALRSPTLINADSADFDLAGHEAVYHGHVRVDDPQMKLVCEQLVADVPQSGGHVNHIVAETNVVIDFTDDKGRTNHATSDKAVYVYELEAGVTNETVTLTGNAMIESLQGTLTGEPIIWDRAKNRMHADNEKMIFRQNLSITPTETLLPSPAKETNALLETHEITGKKTNSPAGDDF